MYVCLCNSHHSCGDFNVSCCVKLEQNFPFFSRRSKCVAFKQCNEQIVSKNLIKTMHIVIVLTMFKQSPPCTLYSHFLHSTRSMHARWEEEKKPCTRERVRIQIFLVHFFFGCSQTEAKLIQRFTPSRLLNNSGQPSFNAQKLTSQSQISPWVEVFKK